MSGNDETFDAIEGIDRNVTVVNKILRARHGRFKPRWNKNRPGPKPANKKTDPFDENVQKIVDRINELALEDANKTKERLVAQSVMMINDYELDGERRIPMHNPDKSTMADFVNLMGVIKDKKKSKWKDSYHLLAMYCESEEDFDLLKAYAVAANTSPCDYRDAIVDGDFEGPDWYFPEETTVDYGMGTRENKYWFETLTHKKNKFNEFLKDFEEE